MAATTHQLQSITDRIHAIERGGRADVFGHEEVMRTGWAAVDAATGGLGRRAIHEWFDDSPSMSDGPAFSSRSGRTLSRLVRASGEWTAPVGLLIHLVRRAVQDQELGSPTSGGTMAVWVGRRCWPSFETARGEDRRMILIDPPDPASRVWAVDLALRCPAVGVVVADGSGWTMAVTRRLQLGAAEGGGIGLIARPPWERGELSAATTRWSVRPVISDQDGPRWSVELLRCKGVQPASHLNRRWVVESSC